MSDDGDLGRRTPLRNLAWPSVFLVLAGAVAYLAYRPALKTPRPSQLSGVPAPVSSLDVGAVYARLWEDPLAACYRDPNAKRVRELAAGRFDKMVEDTQPGELLFLPVLVPGAPTEKMPKRGFAPATPCWPGWQLVAMRWNSTTG